MRELRTVRQGGSDSPQVELEVVPETLLSLEGRSNSTADGPPLGRGQSAGFSS